MKPVIETFQFTPNFGVPEPVSDEGEAVGYARGFDDGLATAAAQASQRIATSLERLEHGLETLHEACTRHWRELERDTAILAEAMVNRLLIGHSVTAAQIETALLQVMADVRHQARIIIRVPAEAASRLEPVLQAGGSISALNIVIAADDALADASFAIEWPDGALRYDRAALLQRFRDMIERTFPSAPSPTIETLP